MNLPGSEFNHSPPSSAEVKNEWRYTSFVPIRLLGVGTEKITFTFTFLGKVVLVDRLY